VSTNKRAVVETLTADLHEGPEVPPPGVELPVLSARKQKTRARWYQSIETVQTSVKKHSKKQKAKERWHKSISLVAQPSRRKSDDVAAEVPARCHSAPQKKLSVGESVATSASPASTRTRHGPAEPGPAARPPRRRSLGDPPTTRWKSAQGKADAVSTGRSFARAFSSDAIGRGRRNGTVGTVGGYGQTAEPEPNRGRRSSFCDLMTRRTIFAIARSRTLAETDAVNPMPSLHKFRDVGAQVMEGVKRVLVQKRVVGFWVSTQHVREFREKLAKAVWCSLHVERSKGLAPMQRYMRLAEAISTILDEMDELEAQSKGAVDLDQCRTQANKCLASLKFQQDSIGLVEACLTDIDRHLKEHTSADSIWSALAKSNDLFNKVHEAIDELEEAVSYFGAGGKADGRLGEGTNLLSDLPKDRLDALRTMLLKAGPSDKNACTMCSRELGDLGANTEEVPKALAALVQAVWAVIATDAAGDFWDKCTVPAPKFFGHIKRVEEFVIREWPKSRPQGTFIGRLRKVALKPRHIFGRLVARPALPCDPELAPETCDSTHHCQGWPTDVEREPDRSWEEDFLQHQGGGGLGSGEDATDTPGSCADDDPPLPHSAEVGAGAAVDRELSPIYSSYTSASSESECSDVEGFDSSFGDSTASSMAPVTGMSAIHRCSPSPSWPQPSPLATTSPVCPLTPGGHVHLIWDVPQHQSARSSSRTMSRNATPSDGMDNTLLGKVGSLARKSLDTRRKSHAHLNATLLTEGCEMLDDGATASRSSTRKSDAAGARRRSRRPSKAATHTDPSAIHSSLNFPRPSSFCQSPSAVSHVGFVMDGLPQSAGDYDVSPRQESDVGEWLAARELAMSKRWTQVHAQKQRGVGRSVAWLSQLSCALPSDAKSVHTTSNVGGKRSILLVAEDRVCGPAANFSARTHGLHHKPMDPFSAHRADNPFLTPARRTVFGGGRPTAICTTAPTASRLPVLSRYGG